MKKVMMRVLALALCVFVLTAGTPFFVFAEPGLQEIPACTEPGGHVFDEYKPANKGTHIAVCSLCGGEFELVCVYADPPVWTDQGNGTHGTVCTFCGGLKTEPCAFADPVVIPPTQTEAGYTTRTCEICLATETDAEVPPENERQESALLGDTDGDGKVSAADARALLRVSVSLETLPNEKLPYGDLDGDGGVTAADARQALRCSVSLEPLPARHEYVVTVEKEAKCKEPGALTFTCAYCGEGGELIIPAKGHRYEVTKETEATCTKPGARDEKCTVCGDTRTVKLSAKGHDWVDATPTAAKYCARCGEKSTGWTDIGGSTYYFNKDGKPVKGWNEIDGGSYYFKDDGTLVKAFIDGLIYTASAGGLSKTGRKPKVAVIGDSIVASIANYDVATDFDMYGKVSLHVNTIDSKSISGSSRTVLREVEGRGYDVVILMLGVNDLTYSTSAWGEMYRGVLKDLKKIVPDAIIYAHAILPINDRKTSSDEKMWRVTDKNKEIKRSADAMGVRFLDIPPGMTDSNGQLPYDAASDGIHFGPTYCRIWYNWTKEQLK